MSLLMDALRRAEENKQDAARRITGAARPPAPADLALEPMPTRPTPPGAAQTAAAEPVSPAAEPAFAAESDRQTARNVFSVKEAPTTRRPLLTALVILALAAVAIGAYVWWELQRMGHSGLAPAPGVATPSRTAAAAPPPAPPAPPAAAAPVPALGGEISALAPPPPRTLPSDPPASPRRSPPEGEAPPTARPPAGEGESLAPAGGDAAPAIRLRKSRPEPDAALLRAHAQMQENALSAARQGYEEALRRDPRNLDALMALAAIAQREGRAADADRYHQLALEADPKDPAVLAAALSAAALADAAGAESRLKSLLAGQPESPPLNFALGNLYARQGRWRDAQAAYFNAVAADGDNPDYLFNLAVSLDQLRQPRLAAQHYRLALEAAGKRAAAFERGQAERRLLELTAIPR